MNKIVSVALSLGILLAGGGVFYHYVIFLPAVQANKEALEAKKAEEAEQARVDAQQKEIAKAKIYTACLADAQGNYIHNWNRACKSRNLGTDCSLPTKRKATWSILRKSRPAAQSLCRFTARTCTWSSTTASHTPR